MDTGFPLEISVSRKLEEAGWMVHNSPLYFDQEEKIPRELDIHAVDVDFSLAGKEKLKRTRKDGDMNKLISHLVIQCKKSSHPWIFFNNADLTWPRIPEVNFKSKHQDFHGMLFEELKDLGLSEHRYLNNSLHKTFHESFTQPNKPSVIYDALITAHKALQHLKTRYANDSRDVHLFIPMIVLDGTLWSANSKTSRSPVKVRRAERVLVQFNRLSDADTGELWLEEEQIIEVIDHQALHSVLKEIKKDSHMLYRCWTNYLSISTDE